MHKCECGRWAGEACAWVGPVEKTVVVEFMPEDRRAAHEAADAPNIFCAGVYPVNGAERVRVGESCADWMLSTDTPWVREVGL